VEIGADRWRQVQTGADRCRQVEKGGDRWRQVEIGDRSFVSRSSCHMCCMTGFAKV